MDEVIYDQDVAKEERGMDLDMLGMEEEDGRGRRAFPTTMDDDLRNAGVRQAGPKVQRPAPLKEFKAGYWDRRDMPRLDPRRLDSEGILQAMSLEELEDRVARRHGNSPPSQKPFRKVLTAPNHRTGRARSKTWKQRQEEIRRPAAPRQEASRDAAEKRRRSYLEWETKLEEGATEEDRQLRDEIENHLREKWRPPRRERERAVPESPWGSFPPDARPGQKGGNQLGMAGPEDGFDDQDGDEDWDDAEEQLKSEDDDGGSSEGSAGPVKRQVVGTGENMYLLGGPVKKKRTLGEWLMEPKLSARDKKAKEKKQKDDEQESLDQFSQFSRVDADYRQKRMESKFAKMYRAVVREVLPLPWETVEGQKSWTDRDESDWKELGLSTDEDLKVQKVLEACGITWPNRLQAAAIPAVFSGRDVILTAMTGCGKTLAFLMPILHKYVFPTVGRPTMRDRAMRLIEQKQPAKVWSRPEALIISPSRELAIQTWRIVRDLLKPFKGLNCTLLVGDQKTNIQDEALKNDQPAIVIGTPGRVLDHALEGRLSFRGLSCAVLDEIDRLLNNSRTDHMDFITTLMKKEAKPQTILVSATLSQDEAAKDYAKKHLVAYRTVGPATSMEMPPRVLHLANGAPNVVKKLMFLRRLHTSTPIPNGIVVFVNNHDRARKVTEQLKQMRILSRMLTANCSTERRGRAIRDMDSGDIDILVATDVATRGLDFRGLTHVVNFDIPHNSLIYAHRAGRCGRHGRNGIVISLAGGGAQNNRLAKYAQELDIELHEANVEKQLLGLVDTAGSMDRVGKV